MILDWEKTHAFLSPLPVRRSDGLAMVSSVLPAPCSQLLAPISYES